MLLNNTDNASSLLESYDDLVNEDSRINRRRTRDNASFTPGGGGGGTPI